VRRWRWRACIASSAVGLAAACSRADLDVITPADGGSVTCPSPALAPGDNVETLSSGGMNRSYVLHVPTTYDGSKPVPLLVDFHALNSSGMQERDSSPFRAQTDPDGAVMAFPTGASGPSGAAWNIGPCCVAGVDDVAFTKAMVEQISRTVCIDPKRIYATGFSMGGGMAHYLACHAADVFAAAAPVAFDLLQDNVGECQPPRPITVISFRGNSDPFVPYDGGPSAVVPGMPVTFLGAQATFQKWADLDQCPGAPPAPDANGCSTFSNCQGGVEVALCMRQGAGPSASDGSIGWAVLKRHSLP
jgi:polyhydroxybutyrate depolymerase